MPIVALVLNLAWEIVAFFFMDLNPLMTFVCGIWLTIDIIILAQVISYAPIEHAATWSRPALITCLFSGVAFAVVAILTFQSEFKEETGRHSGYIANVIMSMAFIRMFQTRQGSLGQSIYIAVFKMLGTLVLSIRMFIQLEGNAPFLNTLFIAVLILDLAYIYMIVHENQRPAISSDRKQRVVTDLYR